MGTTPCSLNSTAERLFDFLCVRNRLERWRSEVGGRFRGAFVDLGKFVFGGGEADLKAFDFAEPALAFGFGDAGGEVVADLDQPGSLSGVWPEQCATDTSMFMDAGRAEGAPAGADGDLATFEVAEEPLPFLVGGLAVFVSRA